LPAGTCCRTLIIWPVTQVD